jgi:hypothetical protein
MQKYKQNYFPWILVFKKMINHAMYFFSFYYANIFFIFEKLGHIQFEINLNFLKERFLSFCGKKLIYLITKMHLACRSQFQILNIRMECGELKINCKMIFQKIWKFIETGLRLCLSNANKISLCSYFKHDINSRWIIIH